MESDLKERIIVLLKKFENLRNAPDKLIYSIWMSEVSEENKRLRADLFMTEAYQGRIKLTSTETIHRTRREVQKEFPELAGNRKERLAKADRVRKNISNQPYITIS